MKSVMAEFMPTETVTEAHYISNNLLEESCILTLRKHNIYTEIHIDVHRYTTATGGQDM